MPVTRIDALGAVAGKEVAIETQARSLLDDRDTDFLRRAGIDRRFEDDDIPPRYDAADGLARTLERCQVGLAGGVDRRWHRDNVKIVRAQILASRREGEARCQPHFLLADLTRLIETVLQLPDAEGVDVEAGDRKFAPEIDGERQSHVTEADDRDADAGECREHGLC